MKIVAAVALHYGKEYLRWAIQSLAAQVDEVIILYSSTGSHGQPSTRPCPDTRHQLYREAVLGAGGKLRWIDGQWGYEGQQRDTIYRVARDADFILVLDADEIWPERLVRQALTQALERPTVRDWRVPIQHYWRSFYRCVLHDPAYPVRLINPRAASGEATLESQSRIQHFGYAQSAAIVNYKLTVHGHKGEFRRDCDWFTDRFLANAQRDCHPVGSEYWNPEPVDPIEQLPLFMQQHPYWGKEIIE